MTGQDVLTAFFDSPYGLREHENWDRLAEAIDALVVTERQVINILLGEWEAAYPEDVFPPFTAADLPNVSPERIAAEMGRHMARTLRIQLSERRR